MTPQMQRALIDLSTYFDCDPAAIFRRVLEVLAERYDGTMAMINLVEKGRLHFRASINPHPVLENLTSLELQQTY